METIRSLIYIISIVSIIGEIVIFLLPDKKFTNSLKFLFILIIISSVFSCLNLIDFESVDYFNDFDDNPDTAAVTNAEKILLDEQIGIIKDYVKSDIEDFLLKHNISYENINISIISEDDVLNHIECEIYLKTEQKPKFENLRESISSNLGLAIRTYYIGDQNE